MDNPLLVIALASLCLGLGAGFVMHRSDFCVTGMFRDFFMFNDRFMLRMLVLLVVVSMLLFELARMSGLVSYYPFPFLGAAGLTTLIAGFVFGIGMVLAGGCVVGTLYRVGAGSVVSLLAFAGMLAGSAAYAEFHPAWAAFGKQTRMLDSATVPQLAGLDAGVLVWPLVVLGGVYIWHHHRRGNWVRPSSVDAWLQPWKAAVILAVIGTLSVLLVGMPLGITTSYAKLGATVESWFAPDHVASLSYFSAVPLNYKPPLASVSVTGGPGPALDAVAAIQYPLIIGVIVGAFASARLLNEARLYYRVPAAQYASALAGGLLLGMSARMVPGCNIWHLWGGVPILATQSLFYLAALIPGCWLGSKLLRRFVLKC